MFIPYIFLIFAGIYSLMILNCDFLKNTNTIINAIPENIPQAIKPRFIEIFAIFPIDRFVIEAMMFPAIA